MSDVYSGFVGEVVRKFMTAIGKKSSEEVMQIVDVLLRVIMIILVLIIYIGS
jgi:hypothetical protein